MKLYLIRHQAAGIIHDFPFDHAPSATEITPILARCQAQHGDKHPKSKKTYWAKVVCVEDGVTMTVACAHGGKAEDVDARASGECPIRAAGLKRWPGTGPDAPEGSGSVALNITSHGTGIVRNP